MYVCPSVVGTGQTTSLGTLECVPAFCRHMVVLDSWGQCVAGHQPSQGGAPVHFAPTWHLTLKVNLKSQRLGHRAPRAVRAAGLTRKGPPTPPPGLCAHACSVLGGRVSRSAPRPPPAREDPVCGRHR